VIGWIVILHLVAGVAVLTGGRHLGRWIFAVAAAPLVVALASLATEVPDVLDGATPTSHTRWVSALSLTFSFRLDGFAAVMALLVTGIGVVVLVYAWDYFAHESSSGRVIRFAGCFTLFAGSMLGLVVADDLWTLFVFWELTSVMSFLLIGLDDRLPDARASAQQALLVTVAGGLVMFGGFVCLTHEAGTANLQGVLGTDPTSTTFQVGLVLVLVGAFAKSAQVPFHFWLPGAMVAPTPVTAFLHSATMVNAGVLIVARFAPPFAELEWWRPLVVTIGGVTMLVGGVAALRRDDAKQLLAFSTVSQLGLLVVVFGVGEWEATAAGVVLLVAHALFKSGLFLTVGAVEHATGTRDLRRLSAVGRAAPWLAASAALCAGSMIGLPPLLGFLGKESALAALVDGGGWLTVALVVIVVGSVLTVAYSIRVWWGLFATRRAGADVATVHHPPGRTLVGAVAVLGTASLLGGIAAAADGALLEVAAQSLDDAARLHLALWPGFHVPLLLSFVIVAVGTVVGVAVTRGRRAPAPAMTLGQRVYARAYSGLLEGAQRVTFVTQSGSLPVYLTVVFCVVVVALGVVLAMGAAGGWGDVVVADSALQAAVAVLAIVVALAVVVARRRFVSVLLLGGVGQALTVIFLAYGAPDLALTQFMIETMTIVAFVLVLRHLPREYSAPPSWAPRALRIGLALAVGVTVGWFALAVGSNDRPTDVTDRIEALSLPQAGGKNVVNVTIVDFRGIDTMGEITVFGIAALGVANLVAASRRRGSRVDAQPFARIGAQSMIFEQVTRMIFHVTLLVSLYVMLRGHNAPGGGFAGGLIAGAAFVFRILAGGSKGRIDIARVPPVALIAVGMVLAIGTGVVALVAGNQFLETAIVHVDLPLIGDVKLVSAAVFDLGVYLLVIGVVVIVLSNLASRTHGGGAMREGAVQGAAVREGAVREGASS
jgi:multicomponent Na+:H+ antiporter subunit A